jgi:hypothetical protein
MVRTLISAKPPISFLWAASGEGRLLVREQTHGVARTAHEVLDFGTGGGSRGEHVTVVVGGAGHRRGSQATVLAVGYQYGSYRTFLKVADGMEVFGSRGHLVIKAACRLSRVRAWRAFRCGSGRQRLRGTPFQGDPRTQWR